MKTITRSNIYLPMAAIILTAVLAVPAAAQQQVPFKGAIEGYEGSTGMPSPTTVLSATSGTGVATHLGKFSFNQEVTVNLANFTDAGSARWIAANGDRIDTTIVGSAEPSGIPDLLKITEIHTITGGTGRFAGAQGSFTVDRMHKQVPEGDGTFFTFGSFHGTITSPGAAH